MGQLDTINQISFVIIICFSFLIFMFTISMNKENSLSKTLGIVFIIPFCICIYSYLAIEEISPFYVFWLSEISLSLAFLISMVFSSKNKSHDLAIYTILIIGLCVLIFLKKLHVPSLYLLSNRNQSLILIYIISVNLIILKYKKLVKQSFFRANCLLLISVVLSLFNSYKYILIIALTSKFVAYATFYNYFYKERYNRFMSKVKEANKLKERVDRELNKEVKKQILHYEITKEKLLMKSKTDSLTKAYNKETIVNIIDGLIKFKKDEKFSILMFDIDNFKKINDTYGHITGDVCIKNLVNAARNSIRDVDVIGRYGGDEFIIVLPSLDIKEAVLLAERLRQNVNIMSNPKFTISIGISSYPQDSNTVNNLISLADERLYVSKKKGKNTVSYNSFS